MEYLYKLVNLLNKYTEENLEIENKIRDLICYISDNPEYMGNELFKSIIFEAAEKLRLFGYIKGTNKISINELNESEIFGIKHRAIQNYYKSKVYKNNLLDRRQKEVIDTFMSLEYKRILVSAPTSFGKTFLLREIIFMNKERYNNILLVFPTIALLNENTANIYELINLFNLEYKVVNNVYSRIECMQKHIFILTPERVLKLISDNDNLKIDFFFFDEIYKIDEDFERNEDSKEVSKKKNEFGNRAKAFRIALYLLSKTVEEFYLAGPYLNLNNLKYGMKSFLEKNKVTTIQINFEPTLRIEYDAWKKNCIEKHPVLGERKEKIISDSICTNTKIKGIIKYIENKKLGQAIFYCATPAKSMEYTKEIIDIFNTDNNNKISKEFIEHLKMKYNVRFHGKNSSRYWSLVNALEHGVGIHHGKFPKYIQNEILRMFNNGDFNYLFCTSTIIEGVNTNAKNIIIINNSVGNSNMTSFTLKNIKGRAGRYYHHNIGRIFYTDKKQREIENSDDIRLDFQTFDNVEVLDSDIDNTDIVDLCENNKKIKLKRENSFDKEKLPDSVFIRNRLFPRDIQERYLNYLLKKENFDVFSPLITKSNDIHMFLSNRLINKILESFEYVQILESAKARIYHSVLSTYSINGTLGILEFHINQLLKNEKVIPEDKMDSAYIKTFEQIRNIVEYEVPKLLCLFEALYQQAGILLNYDMQEFNMSVVIRYFELGITTELGLFLVEFGFPIDTIRKIETTYKGISKLSAIDSTIYIQKHRIKLENIIDSYEMDLYSRAIKNLLNRKLS